MSAYLGFLDADTEVRVREIANDYMLDDGETELLGKVVALLLVLNRRGYIDGRTWEAVADIIRPS